MGAVRAALRAFLLRGARHADTGLTRPSLATVTRRVATSYYGSECIHTALGPGMSRPQGGRSDATTARGGAAARRQSPLVPVGYGRDGGPVRLNTAVRNFEPHPFSPLQFHVLLNSLFKVLFTFPSRYLCAIGLVVVFSLRWSLPPT